MWVIVGLGSLSIIMIILLCVLGSLMKHISKMEKREEGQDIIIEKVYNAVVKIVDRQKKIEARMKHYKII